MDVLQGLMLGFSVAISPINILWGTIGALVGTFVGIMPGLGTSATIAILMPLAFGMEASTALIMMVAIYSGAKYGGAISSILLNLPGESSSVPTCMEGYPLALQGRAGPALGIAAISSFVAGTVSVMGLMLLAPLLASLTTSFGPPEYFSMTLLGLCLVTSLTGKSLSKGIVACLFGLAISVVGPDIMSGTTRLTFGYLQLMDGIHFIIVTVGLFAISEILLNIESQIKLSLVKVPTKLSELLPTGRELVQCIGPWVRSTIIGFLIGVLPGTGTSIASFLSYAVQKNLSKTPELFEKGSIEGLAAAESADNAAVGGTLVPMLSLGIPGSTATAMMMGALIMLGVRPGPFLVVDHADVFWAIVASMYIANIILIIINLPMIPIIVNLLRLPYYILYIVILTIASVGVYSVSYNMFDLFLMGSFGILGYVFKKMDYPLAPTVLAVVLGPLVELPLRQSFIMSKGSLGIFFARPISAVMLGLAVIALFAPLLQQLWLNRSHVRSS